MASIAHMAGESTGASGLLEANGLRPTDSRTSDTTPDTGFGGAGSPSAVASACGSGALATAEEMLATDSTGASVVVSGSAVDKGVAATPTTSVDCWFADDELAVTDRFVRALPAAFGVVCESRCSATDVVLSGATRDNTGFSSGDVAATAEGTAVRVGVASADAVVSLLVEVEPVCAPPELCTTPERGSAVELVSESTELCTASDVEPDEEPSDETDGVVKPTDAASTSDSRPAADSSFAAPV
jgi:hypothetical protein